MLVTIIQWMFDFGICLGVSRKICPYVCYCKREKNFSLFQKPGKSVQTPDYDTPKKIIRKYFFKMGSFRLYWKVPILSFPDLEYKRSPPYFKQVVSLLEDYVPLYFSSLTGFQSAFSYNFFSLLMRNCLFSLVEKKEKTRKRKKLKLGFRPWASNNWLSNTNSSLWVSW